MIKARYYQTDGAEGGEEKLPDWLFDGVVNEDVLHQVIKVHLLNQRQGTAAAKSRGQGCWGLSKALASKGHGKSPSGNDSSRAVGGWWRRVSLRFPTLGGSGCPRRSAPLAPKVRPEFSGTERAGHPRRRSRVRRTQDQETAGRALGHGSGGQGAPAYGWCERKRLPFVTQCGNVWWCGLSAKSRHTDILWATTLVIEKAALDRAEPSVAHRAAMVTRARGEPEVRAHEASGRGGACGSAARSDGGHGKKAAKVTSKARVTSKAKASAKTEAADEGSAREKSPTQAKGRCKGGGAAGLRDGGGGESEEVRQGVERWPRRKRRPRRKAVRTPRRLRFPRWVISLSS